VDIEYREADVRIRGRVSPRLAAELGVDPRPPNRQVREEIA
jgi:hypothetical protein